MSSETAAWVSYQESDVAQQLVVPFFTRVVLGRSELVGGEENICQSKYMWYSWKNIMQVWQSNPPPPAPPHVIFVFHQWAAIK